MSQKIKFQIKRCLSTNRTTYTPAEGEGLYVTDTKEYYIGDGTTPGGILIAGGTGESNTASNVGTSGVGTFKQKNGIDLEFKKINAGSNKISITDDTGNDEIDIDIVEANLTTVVKDDDFDAKGDMLVGTGDGTFDALSVGSDNQYMVADSSESTGIGWITHEPSKYAVTYKNASYTLTAADQTIVCYATTDITITLPLSSVFTNDGTMKEFGVGNISPNDSIVTIQLSGAETFVGGNTAYKIQKGGLMRLGGTYPTLGAGWFVLKYTPAIVQYRRNATWDASNYTTATPAPFDTIDVETDDNRLEANTTNVSRINMNVDGWCDLTYWLSIDSTGGSTWSLIAYLRVNGTTEIPGSRIRVGNYQGEDGAMCLGPISHLFESGDYLELVLDQDSLTGDVNNVILTARETN